MSAPEAQRPISQPPGTVWGDARRGKLLDHVLGFGRALRRAGLPADPARMALAVEAAHSVGLAHKADVRAAMAAVLVSRAQDLAVFDELFDAWFHDPALAQKMLAQMLPTAHGQAPEPPQRPRVREALTAPKPPRAQPLNEEEVQLDAAMTASDRQRLQQADFNALGAQEYALVERLARDIAWPVPTVPSRRWQRARTQTAGPLHWPGVQREAARLGGELLQLPRHQRRQQPLPVLVLVDVSGSMERYARLLLAFLHAATRSRPGQRVQRHVFAFGTGLSDLTPAFAQADTDAMLTQASRQIQDFAGGTRLGDSLRELRLQHARRLVGRRTLVLLISDGLDTGEPAALREELRWLKSRCRRLLWLNPLLRFAAYEPLARGAAELHRASDAMLAVHNLQTLQALAQSIARLLRQTQPHGG